MKKFFSQLLVALIAVATLPAWLMAADALPGGTAGKIHHFTIIAPPSAKVGEAIDVTVEAKDKDDKVLTNYRGSIFFQSDTDFGATIPAQGKAVQFKESDNGVLKISKWVIFKRVGNQELMVTGTLEDDVGWSIKIRVEDSSTTAPVVAVEAISITVPEKGSTVTSDTITISGKTKKNSKVIVKLNAKELGNTQTNEDGTFTYKLSGINQQSNILSASVVDGSNVVIGTIDSQFNYWVKAPTYYNLSIAPAKEVDGGTGITLMIDAEPGLSEVTLMIDGALLTTKEQSPGKYTIPTVSPIKAGSYPIQVTLKNILAQSTTKPDAGILVVKEPVIVAPPPVPKSMFKDVKMVSEGSRININFFVENLPKDVVAFKIGYGESANSLSKEVMTLPREKIQRPDGSYNWYIDKLEPKNYTFKIFWVLSGGLIEPSLSSEAMSALIGKWSCSIGNIGNVKVMTGDDKTVLSWDALSGALSYNVYRLSAAKDYELVENVQSNSYTLFLSSGSIVYQDFAIKALCDDRTESSVPATASRVQTGPWLLAILVAFSALLGIIFLRRRAA
jgi:hypothetical protein